ncbi:MAG: DNA translocase FtsK [Dehalococcoidia bacterium]
MARTSAKPRPTARPRGVVRAPGKAVGKKRQAPNSVDTFVAWLTRVETVGLFLISLGFVALLSLLDLVKSPGILDGPVEAIGLHIFTLIWVVVTVGVIVWQRQVDLFWRFPRYVVAVLPALLFTAGLLSLFSPDWEFSTVSLAEVTAGGDLGAALFGDPLGILLWLASGFAFVALVWPRGVADVASRTPGAMATVWSWQLHVKAWHGLMAIVDFAFPTKAPMDERATTMPPAWLPPEEDDDDEDEELLPIAEEPPHVQVFEAPLRQVPLPLEPGEDADEETLVQPTRAFTPWSTPPIDLLVAAPPADETARPDNALRSSLIVETLASFGVDARVSAFHEGPVVTQFDIEPGWEVKYKTIIEKDRDGKTIFDKDGKPKTRQEEVSRTRVRVQQITSLANDLALALAAPSLRIEAPVPGRSVVGIEVPNTAASVVTMRSVIETPTYQRLAAKTKLALPLGKSVSGEPVVADLAKMPHLLIAGATGAGKSVCINSIISSILMQAKPEEVRFVMVDPKRVELVGFAMIPHLAFSEIIVDMEKVVGTLGAVIHEMEDRYKKFAALAVRNIESYNKNPKVTEQMPFWVVIIDELADLMMVAPFEVERQLCRLAQLARATGIHLVVATQRPSVDVITGLIKANFPTRIAFAVSSQVDSRTILDTVGAERLLGRGDMLYMPTDASKPKRVQGVYLTDPEIDKITAYWEKQRAQHSTPMFDHLLEEAQSAIEEAEDADPMYERAKALAEEHTRISTSMLQRRLRIGYPRAARIMDRLEEEGIVGGQAPFSPTGTGMTSREVIGDDDRLDFGIHSDPEVEELR